MRVGGLGVVVLVVGVIMGCGPGRKDPGRSSTGPSATPPRPPGGGGDEVVERICAEANCAGPMSSIDVWSDAEGKVALYVHQGDIHRCSHPPTTYYDAAGRPLLTQAMRPIVPGSEDARKMKEERDKLTEGRTRSRGASCPARP